VKLSDITAKNDHELAELIRTERDAYAKAVVDSRTKEVKNVKQLHAHKLVIARALTIARERDIAKLEQAEVKTEENVKPAKEEEATK
jgi:ribosomal protein L29